MRRLLLLLSLLVPVSSVPLGDPMLKVVAGRIVCSPPPPLPWLAIGHNSLTLKVGGVEVGHSSRKAEMSHTGTYGPYPFAILGVIMPHNRGKITLEINSAWCGSKVIVPVESHGYVSYRGDLAGNELMVTVVGDIEFP